MEDRIIVGSEEWCAFPTLSIHAIKARVDSGAKTSALHAFNIRSFNRNGEQWVSFDIHPLQKSDTLILRCESPVVDRRTIRSSNGTSERRYVIRVPMVIGGQTWDIELTLTNRDSMGYRMLLGREAMQGRMLVDPSAHFNLGDFSITEVRKMYGVSERAARDLRIGVLASNPELYSNRRLMEAGEERGHEMVFLDIKQRLS